MAPPESVQFLVDFFHDRVDEPLVRAIAADFDLDDAAQHNTAFETLSLLSESAALEQASGFNPAGIPLPHHDTEDALEESTDESRSSRPTSSTHITAPSSPCPAAPSGFGEPNVEPLGRLSLLDNHSQEFKIESLQNIFPELSAFDISHSLKSAKGDYQTAVDDLLNKGYLKSTGEEPKGIDAFFQPDDAARSKSKHRPSKKNRAHRLNASVGSSEEEPPSKGQRLDLSYRLTPLPQEEIDGLGTQPTAYKSPTLHSSAPEDSSLLRKQILNGALQQPRRGSPTPFCKQARSFYAERASEDAQRIRQARSAAADLLVEQQTTRDSVDLHGVQVRDGVRIACQKTREWWDGLGEFRSRKAKEEGFVVVTGIGRHSPGGVSPLRQAVAAALLLDGWQLQVGTGKFIVTGRR